MVVDLVQRTFRASVKTTRALLKRAGLKRAWLLVNQPNKPSYYRLRYGPLGTYLSWWLRISTWTTRAEAVKLAQASLVLPGDPVIVEIGTWLGASTVLLAGARKIAGTGVVHGIDPFDASGDAFSAPIYREIAESLDSPLRQGFDSNVRLAGLDDWVIVHEGDGLAIVATWTTPIDLLLLSGDQSYAVARPTYDAWAPFLKSGGVIAIHNSGRDHAYAPGHDGQMRVAVESVHPPEYADIQVTDNTTHARKI